MDRLGALCDAGVSIWLDDLSRDQLRSGKLDTMRRVCHVTGVTTNPTIFATALATSDDYADQLRELARRGADIDEAIRLITADDVRWACDVLRPAYDASAGVDGRVSIEVDPRFAHNTERTIAEANALWRLVDRQNLFIKIPATDAGLPAIAESLAKGISVNVTLIFGLRRYEQVMEAFLDGVERARVNGHDVSSLASVASFFISRFDSEIDRRLSAIESESANALYGKAAVANAQLAHQRYTQVFSSLRWSELAAKGAKPQRPLWASTSTKNKNYRDVLYVEALVASGVVNTMPESTLRAFADHGEVQPDVVCASYVGAREVLNQLDAVGIDYDDVVATLEREGVEKFEISWGELMTSVDRQMKASR
jgi:transaldolase